MQMFKFNIGGFLQWGYNFYYNQRSRDLINPYVETTGEDWVEGGDAFIVYPGFGGNALESIRLVSFNEGLQDLRAMKLCEELCGREAVLAAIDEVMPTPFDFNNFPQNGMYVLALRAKINSMIEEALS
jgi:hypothetical protein